MAVPAFVARATMVVCLGGGVSLILVTMRMLDAGSGRAAQAALNRVAAHNRAGAGLPVTG